MTPDQLEILKQKISGIYIEPLEYQPCPGSSLCRDAMVREEKKLDEPEESNEDQCYRYL
jgi:hypothetical protein